MFERRFLQAPDDIFNAMKEAALKELLNVGRDHHMFKKLLKDLIIQKKVKQHRAIQDGMTSWTHFMELNRIAGVDKTCKFVKADFMKIPFPDNTFDAVYVIEATCHAPDAIYKSHLSLSSFLLTAVGSFITRNMVKTLEFEGLAQREVNLFKIF
ncbi:hypothetical protein RGQ29_016474 [Quercus rubra]|uniref:Methyltransferase type 11 domain-containing protein n=1 Tax=Quercus rubra TaxID=3512 RepID=A0AAN7FJY1_QUERU|nr:hypothetical protein RGQ29_016474 [Quercus rubra]